ncbi:MAG: hypothetical protein HY011_34215 [Acidobacteria bacterium]|nr:hypothetical protein [Acidobacteriota bacterium]
MQSYQAYQTKQTQFEEQADKKHETTGAIAHWLFLLIGAAISAGASYFIGHKGMAGNDFYESTIGAKNAAWLVVFALDGSFLALVYGMASFLKSSEQRELAGRALVVLKVILCLNILAAFLLIQRANVLPWIENYTVYGSPLVIGAVLWLWSSLYAKRRQNVMMANALDTQATRDAAWAQQYLNDQARNREAYDLAANSPAMNALRNAAARRKAIEAVAAEFALPFAEAERIYSEAEHARITPQSTAKPTAVWRGGQQVGNGVDWDSAPKV